MRAVGSYVAAAAACLVAPAAARAQAPVAHAPVAQALVRVTDPAGRPLTGVSVRLTHQPDSAATGDTVVTTDATGVATIRGLPRGSYRVRASHPAIDRAGVEPPAADLVVAADSLSPPAQATIAPPTLAVLTTRCGTGQLVDTVASRILYGIVSGATATRSDSVGPAPADRARVTVAWTVLEGGRSVRRATPDARGRFAVCGIPDGATPTVSAELGSGTLAAPAQRVAMGAWRAAFVSLKLRPPAPELVPPTIAVIGTIIDSVMNAPLAGAVVQMVAAPHLEGRVYEATSDAAGAFTIADIPPGRYVVHVEHPALNDYGVEIADQLAELPAGSREAQFTLTGPTAAQVLARACPQAGDSTGLLLGRVRAPNDSARVVTGRVRASWNRGAQGVGAAVGSGGVFRLCGVPRGMRVTLRLDTLPGWRSAPRDVLTGRHGVTVTDVVVEAPL